MSNLGATIAGMRGRATRARSSRASGEVCMTDNHAKHVSI